MPDLIWYDALKRDHIENFPMDDFTHPNECDEIVEHFREAFEDDTSIAYSICTKRYGVIAFFGGYFVAPDVAEVWSVMSVNAFRYPVGITKTAKRMLSDFQKELGIKRYQMRVVVGNNKAADWAESLGFVHEYTTKPVKNDNQYWYFGRTF